MKIELLIAAQTCLLAAPVFAQETPPPGSYSTLPEYQVFGEPASPQDAEAIGMLMRRFSEAWGAGDASATASLYAEDAEWTNAFGDVVRGPDNLRAFLGWVFSRDEEASEGESMRSRPLSLRYLGDDVAVVHGLTMSTRGAARSGAGPRRVHVTFILAKQNGEWRIVQQMIMDARE
jgi:uncharacterized protein (TIGR02246 family)